MFELFQSLELTLVALAAFFYFLGHRPPWCSTSRPSPNCHKSIEHIPGPTTLPVLGTTWVFSRLFGSYTFGRIHEYYAEMFERHGPILREEALWNVPVIGVVERSDIEAVLKGGSGKYPIRPPTEAIAQYRRSKPERYASTGLVNEQGEMWYHLRTNLTSDLISTKTINSFHPQIEEIADDWCNLLGHSRNAESIVESLETLASRLGLESICSLVLGRRMGFLLVDEEGSEVTRQLAKAVNNHFIACRDTYYGLPFWKLFPTPAYKKLVESEEAIYNLVLELIEGGAEEAAKESIVFESVLKAGVDPREKTAAIVDFIAAGIYTLRNSLVFLLHSVANNNAVQEAILDPVNGNAYAKACVNESFRLSPTANCLARIIESDLELSGYNLKAGSVVVCHTGLACRNPKNFKNPDQFLPERWLDENKTETVNAATYLVIPFGIGRRTCPGKRFIEHVLPVILTQTVKHFRLSNVKPLELEFEFLLAPRGPVNMVAQFRE